MQIVEEGDQIETILGIVLGRRDPEPGIRYGIVFAGMCLCVFDRARMEVVANELRIWKGLGHQHGGPAVTAPDIGHLGAALQFFDDTVERRESVADEIIVIARTEKRAVAQKRQLAQMPSSSYLPDRRLSDR